MKIFINGTKEILNVGSVIETLRRDMNCVLNININDSAMSPEDLKALFSEITAINVVRNDLNGVEQSETFTEYTQLDKVQRKIVDETDITTVSLVKAAQAKTEGGEDNG